MAQQTLDTPGGFDAFLGGVRTTLFTVEQALLRLGSSPGDQQALEEIYRHTSIIGTSAALMACPTLAQIAHNMAGLLFNIRSGHASLDPPTYALLQGSYLHMQQVVGALASQVRSQEERKGSLSPDSGEPMTVIESHLSPPPSVERREVGHQPERHSTKGEAFHPFPPEEGTATLAIAIIGQYQRQRRTGQLWLTRGTGGTAEEGTITFQQGRILDATSERRRGAEARNWLSTWENCRYRFVGRPVLSPDGMEAR